MAVELCMGTLPPVCCQSFPCRRAGGRASFGKALGEPGQVVLGHGSRARACSHMFRRGPWNAQAGGVALVEALGRAGGAGAVVMR